jgi:hypothetical protein
MLSCPSQSVEGEAMKRILWIVAATAWLAINVVAQDVVFAAPWQIIHGYIYDTTIYSYPTPGHADQTCGMIIKGLTAINDPSVVLDDGHGHHSPGAFYYIPWYVDTVPAWGARQELRAVKFHTLQEAKQKVEEVCK